MALKNYPFAPDADLYAVIQATALAMETRGFHTNIQMIGPQSGVLTVEKDREGFTNILGLGLECRASFSVLNGQLTVNIDGEWANKLIAIAVGWFICLIPIITGIVGSIGQVTLPDKIFSSINMAIASSQNNAPYQQTPPSPEM